jgi:hypothetical protein
LSEGGEGLSEERSSCEAMMTGASDTATKISSDTRRMRLKPEDAETFLRKVATLRLEAAARLSLASG